MATNPSSQSTSSSVWPAVLSHTSKASDTLAQSQPSNLAHASTVAGDHPNAITDTEVLEAFRQRANELKPEITRSQLHIIEWTRLQPISENVKDDDINAGGQGTVRRMKLDEGRLVAVKFPKHPEHFGSLMREILFMTKITSHDNLMRFEGVVMNQELGIYAVVMPLALCDLKEVIERKGPPKTPEDFDLFVRRAIQICQAVQHLHTKTHKSETDSGDKETDGKASPESSRYVHRDIKPANVLVFEDVQYGQKYETLRLADFGLVKSLDASNNTMSGESITGALGSGPYMAPEMWGGGEGGNRGGTFSDVYAIGATLWQMVVGTAPAPVYTSSQSLRNANTPPTPSSKNDRCPPSINDLVYDCLKVLPKERPRLDQVILELQKYRRLNRDAAYKNVDQVCQAFTQLNYVSDEVPDDNVEPVRSVNKQLSRDKLMKAVRNFDDKDDHQASDVEPSESESLAFNKMVNETDDLTPQLVERAVEMSRRLRRKRGLYAEGNLSVTSVVARLLGLDNTVADAFVIRLRLFVDGWGALGRGFLSHHAVVQDTGIIRPVIVCLVQSLLFLGFDVHLLTEHDTDRYKAISAGLPPLILEHFACGKTVQCDADLSESTGACVVIESASLIPPEVGESNASLLWCGYVGVFVVSSSVAEANKVKYKGLLLDVDTIMTAAAKAGTG